MAPLGELPGHEVVAGMEAGQAREVREAGIGREDQDEHRPGLQAVVEEVAERAAAEDDLADLGDHRRGALLVGRHVHLGGEDRQPEEHGAERRPHDHQRRPRVLPLGRFERGHAVGNGLDAGDRRAARSEGAHQHEHRRAHQEAVALVPGREHARLVDRLDRQVAEEHPGEPDAEQSDHRCDEEVGGHREHAPRLADPAEVAVCDERDEEDRDGHRVRGER